MTAMEFKSVGNDRYENAKHFDSVQKTRGQLMQTMKIIYLFNCLLFSIHALQFIKDISKCSTSVKCKLFQYIAISMLGEITFQFDNNCGHNNVA